MNQPQSIPEAVRVLRASLQYSSTWLHRIDEEDAERIARRLDRLRWELKKFVPTEEEVSK